MSKSIRQIIKYDDLLKINQNWGLAFFLDNKAIERISKIKANSFDLFTSYDVSQGYIPYRRSDLMKNYGDIDGNKIVDERMWHSEEKINEEYLPEIFGRELDKYGNINKTRLSFVKYGKHLAGFIDLKYFNQKRILIREITNPKIIATLIEETFVNDPQLISIINKINTEKPKLEILWAVLNSKLATYYHFNNSPKATKGAFPKILVKDIKEFPLPKNFETINVLSILVDFVLISKQTPNIIIDSAPNTHISESFEEVIDALVFELYFPEEFTEKGIEIEKYAQEIFKPISLTPK